MPTDRRDVVQSERMWHDEEAHKRIPLNKVLYAPPAFDEIVNTAFDFLDGRSGELVLDLGCGEGKETINLATRGLHVVSMDLSHKQLCDARDRLHTLAPNSEVLFVQANAEETPFAKHSFRIIYGKAILHHLDLALSGQEIKRLLKPHGRATFAEPFAQHPLFWAGRQITPQLRTRDEHPMYLSELEEFAHAFQWFEVKTFYFLTPISYFLRVVPGGENLFRKAYPFLSKVDQFLFSRFKKLQSLAWYGIVYVKK